MIANTNSRSICGAVSVLALLTAALVIGGCDEDNAKETTAKTDPSSAGKTNGGAAVASVNGTRITESDLELAEAEIGTNLGNLPEPTKRRVLVEYLVENQLFADAAREENLASGPDFDRRLKYWRLRALREAYFDKKVKANIGDDAARALYDDKVKMLKEEEELQTRHILVGSEKEAQDLVAKLDSGSDFAELAKEHSGDAGSKDKGGMLDYFGRGQMVPQFEQAAFALKKGEISKPVQSQFGWHIIKLEDRRQKPPPSFEEVKDHIIGTLVHQRAQRVAENLRAKATVEYLDLEVKALVEADEKKAEAQRKVFEEQMQEQIKQMKLGEKQGAGGTQDTSKNAAPNETKPTGKPEAPPQDN